MLNDIDYEDIFKVRKVPGKNLWKINEYRDVVVKTIIEDDMILRQLQGKYFRGNKCFENKEEADKAAAEANAREIMKKMVMLEEDTYWDENGEPAWSHTFE